MEAESVPLVGIGLTDLPKTEGGNNPQPPPYSLTIDVLIQYLLMKYGRWQKITYLLSG